MIKPVVNEPNKEPKTQARVKKAWPLVISTYFNTLVAKATPPGIINENERH